VTVVSNASGAARFKTVKLNIANRVATVSLARPEVRNAFHPMMIRELTEIFLELAHVNELAAVILRGEGKSFCAGADLEYMKSMAGYSLDDNEKDAIELFDMFWAMRACPHAVVGRVHGHVMGGALGLLGLCDIAAAVDGTQFCFSEVKLGLAPAVISPFVLEKMDRSFVTRFMLTGEVFGPQEALTSGLIQSSGSEADVDQFVAKIVGALSLNGPEALRATKILIREVGSASGGADWRRNREITTKMISERRVSDEGQEGLRGFLEKREPSWRLKK
jgi:methylglutaconyl-CoA hydratase